MACFLLEGNAYGYMSQVVAERDCVDDAAFDPVVVHRCLPRGQAGTVGESDRDPGPSGKPCLVCQHAADQRSNEGHYPHDREVTTVGGDGLGQISVLCGCPGRTHVSPAGCSQIARGSKLAEANMVRITTAANAWI